MNDVWWFKDKIIRDRKGIKRKGVKRTIFSGAGEPESEPNVFGTLDSSDSLILDRANPTFRILG